jgi:guanylate kinase
MYKIIALIGKAGSGKDTILHELIKTTLNLHEIVSCTTRPRREGEVEGVNYFYMTPE